MYTQTAGTNLSHLLWARRPAASARRSVGAARTPKDPALLNALALIAQDMQAPSASLVLLIELIKANAQLQVMDLAAESSGDASNLTGALDEVLNGFLQRTRETGDPLAFRPTLVNLAHLVHRAASLNAPVAESRQVRIDCSAAEPYAIRGDRSLLGEAIETLISTAVKHASTGSTVHCSVTAIGHEAIVSVAGEGDGLCRADLGRSFWPFETPLPQQAVRPPVSGLGLWIARLVAERHGGRVAVDKSDRPDMGVKVSLVLPAERI